MRTKLATLSMATAIALTGPALPFAQASEPEFSLVIQDHRFAPEEFESYDLNREKIVPGKGRIVLFVGPLKPGRYEYFGEFNMATARGWLVAR